MPRPRVHDLGHVLDTAERIAVDTGPAAVTIRALSEATSVSNGALYHAFGSRAGLLARAWLRAAERFLGLQRAAVDAALGDCGADAVEAVEAVVAAAVTPATFLEQCPTSARFLLTIGRDELVGSGDMPAELADDLRRLDTELVDLFIRLSTSLWNRRDARAVALVRTCLVDLPTALVLQEHSRSDPAAAQRLAGAVRAVLAIPPSGKEPRP